MKMVEVKIKCLKCGGDMQEGQATKETLSGIPDFSGDKAVALSPTSTRTIEIIERYKCLECGWSVTK